MREKAAYERRQRVLSFFVWRRFVLIVLITLFIATNLIDRLKRAPLDPNARTD
jgi:hypothetical protein